MERTTATYSIAESIQNGSLFYTHRVEENDLALTLHNATVAGDKLYVGVIASRHFETINRYYTYITTFASTNVRYFLFSSLFVAIKFAVSKFATPNTIAKCLYHQNGWLINIVIVYLK